MGARDPVQVLRSIVGADHVLVDADVRAGYEVDWTGRWRGRALAVVRPGSTEEVAAIVAACAAAGVAVLPQGGNTGLVGGGAPAGGEVVLSLRRLTRVGDVDPLSNQVTVGAGVVLADLQAALEPGGRELAIDLAARDSATIGGLVATNAGGLRVLRHGTMRAQVVGLEAVLADGTVVSRLAGLAKDATGYDLSSLLVGSEGTLGVVTAARLRLVPRRPARVTALLALASVADAVSVAATLRDRLDSLDVAELVVGPTLALVAQQRNLASPFTEPPVAALLVECGARTEAPVEALAEAVLASGPLVLDVAVGDQPTARARLWQLREEITDALQAAGPPRKLDVSLPLDRLAAFADDVVAQVGSGHPGAACHLFGHVLDGNLHVNVLGVDDADGEAVDELVLGLVATAGGSIGAEHGIGRAKVRWLHLSRSPAELAAFRAIKAALDPAGTLSPGVLLPGSGSGSGPADLDPAGHGPGPGPADAGTGPSDPVRPTPSS